MKYPSFEFENEEVKSRKNDLNGLKYVQIGFNKTATSWMEDYFYPEILGLDCFQGAGDYSPRFRKINEAVDYICFERDSKFDSSIAINLFYLGFKEALGRVPEVFMHESFTFRYFIYFDQKRVIKRLASVFKNCQFVMGSREVKSWLISHYNQYIRSGGNKTFDNFLEVLIDRKNSDLYMCFFGEISSYCYQYFGKEKFIFYDINELIDFKSMEKIFDFTLKKKYEQNKINKSETEAILRIMRVMNYIIPHDCGANPYDKSETDIAPRNRLDNFIHKIKYKYKYMKVPIAKGIGSKLDWGIFASKFQICPKKSDKIHTLFEEDEKLRKQNLSSKILI